MKRIAKLFDCPGCGTPIDRTGGRKLCAFFSGKNIGILLPIHSAVHKALRAGILVKHPCEVCGSEKSDAHHDDYAQPLDVRWLCRRHHKQHHREFGPGKNHPLSPRTQQAIVHTQRG